MAEYDVSLSLKTTFKDFPLLDIEYHILNHNSRMYVTQEVQKEPDETSSNLVEEPFFSANRLLRLASKLNNRRFNGFMKFAANSEMAKSK
jgi:hypothetical protein